MPTSSDLSTPSQPTKSSLPIILWIPLIISTPGTMYLAARLIYEQTILTWQQGPQMVGFSLMHSNEYIVLIIISLLVTVLWFLVSLIWFVVKTLKRVAVSRRFIYVFCFIFLLLLIFTIPYGWWQSLTVSIAGPGKEPAQLLSYFSATGNLSTVRSILAKGVDVNVQRKDDGGTALMGACVEGKQEVVQYLISQGADVNIKNSRGETAYYYAITTGHSPLAKILVEHGAREN